MQACLVATTELPYSDNEMDKELIPEMVFIQGGFVQVGTDITPPLRSIEDRLYFLPKKQIELKDFYFAKTTIPMRLYRQFLVETGYGINIKNMQDNNVAEKYLISDMSPAIFMNWYEAVLFCNWLSRKEKLEPVYLLDEQAVRRSSEDDHFSTKVVWNQNANGYRLPTFVEWDYAILSEGTLVDEMKKNPWEGLVITGGSVYDRINTILDGGYKNKFGIFVYFGGVNRYGVYPTIGEFTWEPGNSKYSSFYKKDEISKERKDITSGFFGEIRTFRSVSFSSCYGIFNTLASWEGGFITIRVVRNAE